MAYPTAVNSQITDSITQTNLSVLGNAPAMAMGTLYSTMAHSIGILYQNSTMAQQHAAISSQAATNLGVRHLYSTAGMAGAAATAHIARSDTSDVLLAFLLAMAISKR